MVLTAKLHTKGDCLHKRTFHMHVHKPISPSSLSKKELFLLSRTIRKEQMKKIILPDTQLNQFVNAITQSLLKGKEFPEGVISGEEILEFAAHKQVNHFVLFQIYQDWNAHLQKLSHPYFDFTAPDVRQGLRQFLNILSQNIRVPASDFRKMLQHAVYNTLKLILNPEDALANFFFLNTESIPLKLYEKHSPYFKDFDFALKALGRFFEKNALEKVEKELFIEKFKKVIDIYEKKEGKDIFEYQRELFQSLTGRDLAQFTTPPKPRNFYEEEEAAEETPSTPEEKEETPVPEAIAVPVVVEAEEKETPVVEAEVKTPVIEPVVEKVPVVEAKVEEKAISAEKLVEKEQSAPIVEKDTEAVVPDWIKREQERRKAQEAAVSSPEEENKPEQVVEEISPVVDEQPAKEETPAVSVEVKLPVEESFESPKEEAQTQEPVVAAKEETAVVEETPIIEMKSGPTPVVEIPEVKPPVVEAPIIEEKIEASSRLEAVKEDIQPAAEAEAPVAEETKSPTLNDAVEKDEEVKTVSEMLKEAAEKPRSVNEMFSAADKKPASNLLERAQENIRKETGAEDKKPVEEEEAPAPRKRVISLLQDPRTRKAKAEEERKKAEAEAARKAAEEKAKAEAAASSEKKSTIDLFAERKKEEEALKERLGDEQGSGTTIAKKLSEIQSIQTDQIPVHKQFQYVQKVFGGSSVKFKVVLDKINKTESQEEAEAVLERYVFNDPNVNRNDKVCREFEDLVRGRFSWEG